MGDMYYITESFPQPLCILCLFLFPATPPSSFYPISSIIVPLLPTGLTALTGSSTQWQQPGRPAWRVLQM